MKKSLKLALKTRQRIKVHTIDCAHEAELLNLLACDHILGPQHVKQMSRSIFESVYVAPIYFLNKNISMYLLYFSQKPPVTVSDKVRLTD